MNQQILNHVTDIALEFATERAAGWCHGTTVSEADHAHLSLGIMKHLLSVACEKGVDGILVAVSRRAFPEVGDTVGLLYRVTSGLELDREKQLRMRGKVIKVAGTTATVHLQNGREDQVHVGDLVVYKVAG